MIDRTRVAIFVVTALVFCGCDNAAGPGVSPEVFLQVVTQETMLSPVDSSLVDPIVVRVVDRLGDPLSGVDVSFSVYQGSGYLSSGPLVGREIVILTDADGYAQAGWRLELGTANYVEATLEHDVPDDGPAVIRAVVHDDKTVMILGFHWFESTEYLFPHVEGLEVPYDHRVLESRTFLTFTDNSADLVRLNFASWAEEAWSNILTAMGVDKAYIDIRHREDRVWIYTKRTDDYGRQYTFNYGFLIYGIDSPAYNRWGEAVRQRHQQEIAHEVMHMVQYKMGAHYQMVDDWFMEGIAEHISGGAISPITTVGELEGWIAHPYHTVSPIDIRSTSDFPEPYLSTSGTYYPLFHLVLDYLLSDRGCGKTFVDVRHVLEDIAEGDDFTTAFERHFEIETDSLRENLFDLLRGFVGAEGNRMAGVGSIG